MAMDQSALLGLLDILRLPKFGDRVRLVTENL
jgi:hypothetical protein